MMLYLHELARLLYGTDAAWAKRKTTQWKEQMETDQVDRVIASLQERAKELGDLPAETRERIESQIGYLENNRQPMTSGTFRKAGYFYGSGVVEAGGRAVVGKRLKQSGMFWTRKGAENVRALRCALLGNRWDECGDQINHSNQFSHALAASPLHAGYKFVSYPTMWDGGFYRGSESDGGFLRVLGQIQSAIQPSRGDRVRFSP